MHLFLIALQLLACAPEPPPPAAPAIVWPPEPVFQAVPAEEVAARALTLALPTVRDAVLYTLSPETASPARLNEAFGSLRPPPSEDRSLRAEYRWHREAEAAAWVAMAPLQSVAELCAQVPGVLRCKVPSDSSGGECFSFVAPSVAVVHGIAAVRDDEGRTFVGIAAAVTDVDGCTRALSYSLVLLAPNRERVLWRGSAERTALEEAFGFRINGCYFCTAVVPAEKRKP